MIKKLIVLMVIAMAILFAVPVLADESISVGSFSFEIPSRFVMDEENSYTGSWSFSTDDGSIALNINYFTTETEDNAKATPGAVYDGFANGNSSIPRAMKTFKVDNCDACSFFLLPADTESDYGKFEALMNGREVLYFLMTQRSIDNSNFFDLDGIVESVYVSREESSDDSPDSSSDNNITMGQQNAIGKAQSYLSFTAFSYTGLIEQLEYEGFSHDESVYAADNCGADWYEQAAKKAESYLSFTSFSRQGLIDQLEYEGFTTEQAEYAAESVGY